MSTAPTSAPLVPGLLQQTNPAAPCRHKRYKGTCVRGAACDAAIDPATLAKASQHIITSCGALVLRTQDPDNHGAPCRQVLAIRRCGRPRLELPKGRMEDGEGEAETAVREVTEETGLECSIDHVRQHVGTVQYMFTHRGFGQCLKRVLFFAFTLSEPGAAWRFGPREHHTQELHWLNEDDITETTFGKGDIGRGLAYLARSALQGL